MIRSFAFFLFFNTFICLSQKHLGNIYGGFPDGLDNLSLSSPVDHSYMVTFPAACCREGYRDMVVFIHNRVKDVGSDGTVRVDVLWNEPTSGVLFMRAETESVRINLRE